MTPDLQMLVWSAVLFLVQMAVAASGAQGQVGLPALAGNREDLPAITGWAGLRSFAPDRLPVYGFAAGRRDFFWCAGQGGFGIQTAPAGARLAASLLLGTAPDGIAAGLDPTPYLADRFG